MAAAEMPADVLDPPIQHRIAPIANALMKHARTQEKGHEMLQTILRGGTLPAELNFPTCTGQELEMAFAKCVPMWEKNKEKDIDELVQTIQEKSWSTMDVDERFRRLQARIGSKLRKGILTQEVLNAAQAKCHEYWSRVTPGNVATVVEKITSKCSDWKSAESKFDWIWRQGGWTNGNRSVDLNGRVYTAEDLEQAERRCRTKFGQPASGERRIERSHVGRKREAPKEPTAPSEPAEPAVLPSEPAAPEAPPVPAALPAAEAEAHEAHEHRRAQAMSEFLAQRVLGRCNSVESAEKFFVWLREQAQAGEHIRGRPCTLEDVALAEQRCKEEWARKDSSKVHGGADTSSSSSSSDSDDEKAKKKKEQGGVDELVEYVKRKTSNKAKIEQYFNGLFAKVGQKVRAVGRPMSHAEITEAWMRCTQEEEPPKKKPRPQRAPSRRTIAPKEESNADYMVHQILQKCSDLNKAQHYINWLHENVGKPTPSGRTFALDEVTEAELRVLQFFEEGGGDQAASSSSDSESSSLKPRRRRKNKEELKKSKSKKDLKRKRTVGAEELEGALFGSDSEELSGEESVDEEQTVGAEVWADLGDVNETALEDGYPVQHWEELTPEVLPGLEGFNRRATAVMIKAQVGQGQLQVTFDEKAACPPLQPHQEAVSFLMHPKSPISRLLVDHPTGSGKTREMIKVLDNYFFDSRAKIPIFPKDPVCRNFYAELLRWPNRYRDYFCCERPADAAIACGKTEWKGQRNYLWDLSGFPEEEVRRLCYSIREVLEMKGMFFMGRVRRSLRAAFHKKNPGECMPAAPLRALGYTSAGGCFATIGKNGKPLSALMKIGYASGTGNVYSNKIVLMDEAHNLVRSQTQYAEQLQRLRRLLFEADRLVLAGFTGTPILSEPNEGRQLLDIVKGVKAPTGDEGFLSSFPMRPQPLFPVSLPRGLPDGALTIPRKKQLVRRVEMRGEALKVYDLKRRLGLPGRRLRAYCNVCIFHAAFHDGRAGSKGRVLAYPDDCCPKLLQIAQAVVAEPLKSVIMIGRTSGFVVMLELMKRLAAKADPPFQVATMNELSEFNHCSNLRGEKFRVLVADSLQCSEGVSFLSVRKTFLADVPVSPSGFIQQCGRSIRMYGHRGLPDEEQTVTTQLYVTMLPKWMRSSSLACWALRAQKKHTSGKEVEKKARILTARMNRAGIHSLEELKARLDAHGEAKMRSLGRTTKEGLTVEDVLTFLEQNGLWEEARLLRNADKKDKEKEKGNDETQDMPDTQLSRMESGVSESQLARGVSTAELLNRGGTLEEDDLQTALASMLEEVLEKDEEMALAGGGSAAEKRQELEALKEEQRADADELDGEEKSKAPAPSKENAPFRRLSSKAFSISGSEVADKTASNLSAPEMVAALGEVLSALRAACRDAEKKPEKSLTGEKTEKSTGEDIPETGDVEMAAEVASEPTEGKGEAEAAEVGTAPPAEAPAAEAPPAAVPAEAADPVPAPAAAVFGQEPWRAPLVAALEKAQVNGGNAFAAARSAIPSLDPATCDLKMISLHQVRSLRDEVAKVEKVETLRMAVSMIKEVKNMIAELQAPAKSSSSKDPSTDPPAAAAPEAAQPSAPDPAPATDAAAPAAADTVDPPVEQNPTTVPESAEAPAPVAEAPEAPVAKPVPVVETLTPEQRQEKELQWRRRLAQAFRELRRSEHVKAALEVAAPGVMEKTMAAEAKVDADKDPTQEEEEDSDFLSLGIGPEHVKRLHDELARLLELAEKGVTKPRAMVRAMQMLYLADSTSEAIASLKPETADEEALQQLAERTEEFAPALEAMRSLAVDRDVFAHLAEDLEEEHPQVHSSESEASDLDKELVGKKIGPAPVVLPPGWRMEWVKRKKNEMREFVDPEGNRYRNVREVRAALLEYEARQAALAAAKKAQEAMAAARQEAANAPKRRRLRGKCPPSAFVPGAPAPAPAAAVEDAFAEDLMKALGLQPEAPSPAKTPAAPSPATAEAASSPAKKVGPQTGCKVRLKDCEKPALNGKLGRLGDFDAKSGCWECFMETGGKVHAKEAQLELLSATSTAKRNAPPSSFKRPATSSATTTSAVSAKRGRGGGRGRGRGQKAAEAEDSD